MPICSVLVFLSCFYLAQSYNILAVLPMTGKSHFIMLDPLLVKLAEQGNHVTVYSPFPKNQKSPSNYEEIDISKCFPLPTHLLTLDAMISWSANYFKSLILLFSFLPGPDSVLTCEPLRKLLKSSEKYDLLITETFHYDITLLFGYTSKVPIITFTPNVMFPWLSDRMGNPNNPSYIPDFQIGFLSDMTFWERTQNTLLYVTSLVLYDYYSSRNTDLVFKHTLGESAPSVYQLIRNISLTFTGSNFDKAIPVVPNVIDIAGIHITGAAPLPEVCMRFLNYFRTVSGSDSCCLRISSIAFLLTSLAAFIHEIRNTSLMGSFNHVVGLELIQGDSVLYRQTSPVGSTG